MVYDTKIVTSQLRKHIPWQKEQSCIQYLQSLSPFKNIDGVFEIIYPLISITKLRFLCL